jgi:hypothetical protein
MYSTSGVLIGFVWQGVVRPSQCCDRAEACPYQYSAVSTAVVRYASRAWSCRVAYESIDAEAWQIRATELSKANTMPVSRQRDSCFFCGRELSKPLLCSGCRSVACKRISARGGLCLLLNNRLLEEVPARALGRAQGCLQQRTVVVDLDGWKVLQGVC